MMIMMIMSYRSKSNLVKSAIELEYTTFHSKASKQSIEEKKKFRRIF